MGDADWPGQQLRLTSQAPIDPFQPEHERTMVRAHPAGVDGHETVGGRGGTWIRHGWEDQYGPENLNLLNSVSPERCSERIEESDADGIAQPR